MKIEFYEDENGYCPVADFLENLELKMRVKTLRSIQFLENLGTSLRMPISQALGGGIFELRAQSGNNITRVLYFFVIGDCAVLTHGFIKKTQKTPLREIEKQKKSAKRISVVGKAVNNGISRIFGKTDERSGVSKSLGRR